MSKKLVKHSLFKFLNDNLSNYITYDSSRSNLTDIVGLYSSTDITYTAPTPITEIVITQSSINFNTDIDLTGMVLVIEDLGLSDTIASFNNITSTVMLDNGFEEDILTAYEITILQESLIYMDSPHGMIDRKTRLCSLGHRDRWDLYVKIKDDSNKDKIDDILQNIRDLICSNDGKFKIYDSDLITVLGDCSIDFEDIDEKKMYDINGDLQSILVSFIVEYRINYK